MPLQRSQAIAPLTAAAFVLVGTLWTSAPARRERPSPARIGASVRAAVASAVSMPAPPTPLRFDWPSAGRARVEAEHHIDGRASHESFLLEWRRLPEAGLLVEAHPLPGDAFDARPPGATRSSGTLLTPSRALVANDGRFLSTPGIDDLRSLWNRAGGRLGDEDLPEPLGECWTDWVGRWVGVALSTGEEQELRVENTAARAWIRCTRSDSERVCLEYRLERPPGSASRSGLAPVASREVRCALERSVEAELGADDLRPRRVRRSSRWTWTRGEAEVVRVIERESLYRFDWSPGATYAPAAARSADLPRELEAWAGRRWPGLTREQRQADVDWWRDVWSESSPLRRAHLLAAARDGCPDLGTRLTRRCDWLELRPALERVWDGESLTRAPRVPVRVWVENGPPEASVDVLFVGDGYTATELTPEGRYWIDVQRVAAGLFEMAPIAWYRDWFNVRALFLESKESGCDVRGGPLVDTALDTHVRGMRLSIGNEERLLELLHGAGEADVVFLMVNAREEFGTAIPLDDPRTPGHPRMVAGFSAGCDDPHRMAAHEMGHALARLADEYVDPERARSGSILDKGSPNAILAGDPEPWAHFRALPGAEAHAWSHEGALYRAEAAFRPWERCCMRYTTDPFCPVCCEALARAIYEKCGVEWDDEAYHGAHPLEGWEK